jgi:hypothetical protein
MEGLQSPVVPGESGNASGHEFQLTGDNFAPEHILPGNSDLTKPFFDTVLGHPARADQ